MVKDEFSIGITRSIWSVSPSDALTISLAQLPIYPANGEATLLLLSYQVIESLLNHFWLFVPYF